MHMFSYTEICLIGISVEDVASLENMTRTLASRTAHTRLAGGLSGFIFNGHDTRHERRPTRVPILYVRIIRVVRGPHSDNPFIRR